MPTASYHPSGPIGDVVFTLVPDGRFKHVVVIGLGAGALAAYAGKDARMDFFEIDEAVIQIVENPRYFTYFPDARARPGVNVRTTAVDGRLGLRAMPEDSYDLIVIDAFSSDAIPTHLITREAVALYESRLKARGLIAFHVSSRFFDPPPVSRRLLRIGVSWVTCATTTRYRRRGWPRACGRPSGLSWRAKTATSASSHIRPHDGCGSFPTPAAPLWTDDYTSVLGIPFR